MQIFLNVLNGITIIVDVDPTDKMDKIKSIVQDKQGIATSQQILIYNGKILHDLSKTYVDYNIADLSVINIQVSLQRNEISTINLCIDLSDILLFVPAQNKQQCHIKCDKHMSLAFVLKQLQIIHLLSSLNIHANGTKLTISQIYNLEILDIINMFDDTGTTIKIEICPTRNIRIPHQNVNREFIRKLGKMFEVRTSSKKDGIPHIKYSELGMMCSIISFMTMLKSTDPLLSESVLCLLKLTKQCGFPAMKNKVEYYRHIIPSILEILSYPYMDKVHCDLLECISNIMVVSADKIYFIDLFLKHNILNILKHQFAHPCFNKNCLQKLSKIYLHICAGSKDNLSQNWSILQYLHMFLFYEDCLETVVDNIMRGYSGLINEHLKSNRDIDAMLSEKYRCTELEQKYQEKLELNVLIFDGFIHDSKIEFIPPDVACIIYTYYNCYNYKIESKMSLLQRLTYILNKDNGYPVKLKNSALNTLQRIVQYCSLSVTNTLIYKYSLLDILTILLNDIKNNGGGCNVDDIYWILGNAAFDNFESIWNADMFDISIDIFNLYVKRNGNGVVGSLVAPLCSIIDRINENDKLVDTTDKNEIIKGFCVFIDKLIQCPTNEVETFAFNCNDIITRMLDVFYIFLRNDSTKNYCILQLNGNNGEYIMKQINENKATQIKLKIRDANKRRARHILTHFLALGYTSNTM